MTHSRDGVGRVGRSRASADPRCVPHPPDREPMLFPIEDRIGSCSPIRACRGGEGSGSNRQPLLPLAPSQSALIQLAAQASIQHTCLVRRRTLIASAEHCASRDRSRDRSAGRQRQHSSSMYHLITGLYAEWTKKPRYNALMVGAAGVGKSCLLEKVSTVATLRFQLLPLNILPSAARSRASISRDRHCRRIESLQPSDRMVSSTLPPHSDRTQLLTSLACARCSARAESASYSSALLGLGRLALGAHAVEQVLRRVGCRRLGRRRTPLSAAPSTRRQEPHLAGPRCGHRHIRRARSILEAPV